MDPVDRMRRISSRHTYFSKRIFPVFWFALLVLIVLVPLLSGHARRQLSVGFFLVPVLMAVAGLIIMRVAVFNLADEVWDCGDELLVRKDSWEERIALTNIINVGSSRANPSGITLTLREPCRFGREVSFAPIVGFGDWSRSKIARELIERIDEKRRR